LTLSSRSLFHASSAPSVFFAFSLPWTVKVPGPLKTTSGSSSRGSPRSSTGNGAKPEPVTLRTSGSFFSQPAIASQVQMTFVPRPLATAVTCGVGPSTLEEQP
jgi:hypothetical protein